MGNRVITRDEARMQAAFECLALDMAELNQTLTSAAKAMKQAANLIQHLEAHRGE